MSDTVLTVYVTLVRHGFFKPDGEDREVEYGSLTFIENRVRDEDDCFGRAPAKLRVSGDNRAEVLRTFRKHGIGEYEVAANMYGDRVVVEAIKPSSGTKSQGKAA